jgi:putative ABC transport system permease protein
MTNTQLLLIYAFVGLAILLSWVQQLKLEKDLLVGTVRATVQLLVVGYILHFIFAMNRWPYIALMVLLMITVAASNVAGRGKGLPKIFWSSMFSLTVTEVIAMGLLLVLRIVPTTPQYIIPVSGMIVGNGMVCSGLLVNRLRAEAAAKKQEVLVALSLGASSAQAASGILRQSVRASSIPIVDNLKTVGLVQLPGMMTGMIIAGASPLTAVRYQMMVMFVLTVANTFCSIILGYLVYQTFFTQAHQLRSEMLAVQAK